MLKFLIAVILIYQFNLGLFGWIILLIAAAIDIYFETDKERVLKANVDIILNQQVQLSNKENSKSSKHLDAMKSKSIRADDIKLLTKGLNAKREGIVAVYKERIFLSFSDSRKKEYQDEMNLQLKRIDDVIRAFEETEEERQRSMSGT